MVGVGVTIVGFTLVGSLKGVSVEVPVVMTMRVVTEGSSVSCPGSSVVGTAVSSPEATGKAVVSGAGPGVAMTDLSLSGVVTITVVCPPGVPGKVVVQAVGPSVVMVVTPSWTVVTTIVVRSPEAPGIVSVPAVGPSVVIVVWSPGTVVTTAVVPSPGATSSVEVPATDPLVKIVWVSSSHGHSVLEKGQLVEANGRGTQVVGSQSVYVLDC